VSVFGRRRKQDDESRPEVDPDSFVDDLDEQDRAYEDALLVAELEKQEVESRRVAAPQGPWDAADQASADPDVPRLDLGGLLVPVPDDTEVRVDLSPEGQVVAATLVRGDSAMQVGAFAAPRSEGIWAEVREEIAASLRESGGRAEEGEGPFGTELRAAVPTEVPDQGVLLAPARFLGVDGPRWFLRALLTGPAAVEDEPAAPFLVALRQVVVVRGTDPMAVRDPLALRLPPDTQQQPVDHDHNHDHDHDHDHDHGDDQPRTLPPLAERGPEITEIR
jgi:Protein of unknown function (DUF3710)